MKAFLSHSSENKDFVETVAKELGRQYCLLDKFAFQSAIEFKQSIEHGLDESNVFALFASPESLDSVWVKFEIDEAFYRFIQQRLRRVIVLLMGDTVTPEQLPQWLRRSKAVVVKSPKQAAREIRLHLSDLLRAQNPPLFVGRGAQIAEAENLLLSSIDGKLERFLTFVGLPQIGRRSVAKRVAQNVLAMGSMCEISIEGGDDLRDLAFKLAAEVEPHTGQGSLIELQKSIGALSDEEALARARVCLRSLVASGTLPVFVDTGGLVEENGTFAVCFHPLLRDMAGLNDVYAFFITSRKPGDTGPISAPIVRIPSMPESDARKLLQGHASRAGIQFDAKQLSQLVDHVSGYPPSCKYAVDLAKFYGVPVVLADSAELVDFRVSTFVGYISRHTLSTTEKELLRLLANFSPLPLPVIGAFLNLKPEDASVTTSHLIDFSMLHPDSEGWYQISEPLTDAIFRWAKYFTKGETRRLAECLEVWFKDNPEEVVSLASSRVVYRVAKQASHASLADRVVYLTADTFRLAELAYHQQNYEEAIIGFRKVLALRPKYDRATILLTRALAQMDEWAECDALCSGLENAGRPLRTTAYLRGFVARKRSQNSEAFKQFELALQAGRNDVPVLRELASCHFVSGNFAQADSLLKEAFMLQPDNPYLIDLSVQVAMGLGKMAEARKQLDRLKVVDAEHFYWHRLATFYSRNDDLNGAVNAGLQAVSTVERPRFEALAHLAYCQIRLSNLDVAQRRLAEIEKLFPRFRKNITFALQSQLELKAGNYEQVLKRIDRASAAGNRFLATLRQAAIQRLLANPGIGETRRLELQKEITTCASATAEEPSFQDLPK